MKIAYLDGPRLRRALIAACDYTRQCRAELNRINVFPVPDGDTGTNLALTVHCIADRLRGCRERSVDAVARKAADAGILGARGNCGMILSHFLLGFSTAIEGRSRLSAGDFAVALRSASDHLYRSLERPVEGTMLTVIRETADEAGRSATHDFTELLDRLLARARDALARTPDLLPALRVAGVVDAGAKGFVHLLEGIGALVRGEGVMEASDRPGAPSATIVDPDEGGNTAHPGKQAPFERPAAAAVSYPEGEERYRFCTEALVRGERLPSAETVRAALRGLGDSLIVIRGAAVLKVHIHTDEPEAVLGYLRTVGELATHKAEDMRAQHAAVERAAAAHIDLARRPVSIVTDSVCDLPEEVIRAHGIHVVPVSLIYGDEVLLDRVDIDAETYVERLRRGERPTTSQPAPAAFFEAYARAAEDGEEVLAVLLASTLSGTYASGETAAKQFDGAPVHVVDSRGASLAEGLLVLRAAELAELGMPPVEIAAELDRTRERSGIFFTIDTLDNLLASGRVSRSQAWLAGLLNIRPILGLDHEGGIVPAAKVRGRGNVLPRMLALIEKRVPPDSEPVRFGIIHVGCPEIVPEIRSAIHARYPDAEILTAPAAPALATHIGPGAWGIAFSPLLPSSPP